MRIYTDNIELSTDPVTSLQEDRLVNSGNAMRAFRDPPNYLPTEGTYLTLYSKYRNFLGAILIDEGGIHPMILERNRKLFHECTDLAILYCVLRGILPKTTVQDTPELLYMHDFLVDTVGVLATDMASDSVIYSIPANWQPRSIETFTVEL